MKWALTSIYFIGVTGPFKQILLHIYYYIVQLKFYKEIKGKLWRTGFFIYRHFLTKRLGSSYKKLLIKFLSHSEATLAFNKLDLSYIQYLKKWSNQVFFISFALFKKIFYYYLVKKIFNNFLRFSNLWDWPNPKLICTIIKINME